MGEWSEVHLKSLCSKITKGTTPTTAGGGFAEAGINFIKSESISYDGSIDATKFAYIDVNTHDKLKRSQIEAGDILYSIAGVHLGKCASATPDILPANTNQAVAIIRVSQQAAERKFVEYVLRNRSFVDQVLGGVAQSAQPNVNLTEIGKFHIPLPPRRQQKEIAAVLSALDDKIELNRQTNETLEAIARALFKDWFVDFGPTRAKAEGRPPYLAPELWDLFPDALDDEDKPVGWKVGSIGDLADINDQSWTARNHPPLVEYVDLSNAKWGNIDAITTLAWEDAPSRARRIARTGDTIVGTTRPGNGSFAYISQDGLTVSTGFAVLSPREAIYRDVVHIAATRPDNIDRLANLADGHGGAYPAVKPNEVSDTELVLPGNTILTAFSELVSPLRAKVEHAKTESRSLAQTRDLLLPKLMSGEIRQKDVEKLAEVAV